MRWLARTALVVAAVLALAACGKERPTEAVHKTVDRFGKQLDTMIGNDLAAQLLAALRAKYGVTVNEQVFAAAFQPQQQP